MQEGQGRHGRREGIPRQQVSLFRYSTIRLHCSRWLKIHTVIMRLLKDGKILPKQDGQSLDLCSRTVGNLGRLGQQEFLYLSFSSHSVASI